VELNITCSKGFSNRLVHNTSHTNCLTSQEPMCGGLYV
jgi:hypothetical protein